MVYLLIYYTLNKKLIRSQFKPHKSIINASCSLISLIAGAIDHIPKDILPIQVLSMLFEIINNLEHRMGEFKVIYRCRQNIWANKKMERAN